jgi:hypothetical protein
VAYRFLLSADRLDKLFQLEERPAGDAYCHKIRPYSSAENRPCSNAWTDSNSAEPNNLVCDAADQARILAKRQDATESVTVNRFGHGPGPTTRHAIVLRFYLAKRQSLAFRRLRYTLHERVAAVLCVSPTASGCLLGLCVLSNDSNPSRSQFIMCRWSDNGVGSKHQFGLAI